MNSSVWTEPRDKKESEQSEAFPFVFHMTEEFSCHSSHSRICFCLAFLVRVCRDYRSCKSL